MNSSEKTAGKSDFTCMIVKFAYPELEYPTSGFFDFLQKVFHSNSTKKQWAFFQNNEETTVKRVVLNGIGSNLP
jgi:hypothetical protein